MPISPALREDFLKLLGDNEITQQMIANLDSADKDTDLLQQAWLPILQQLNADYYVARDNTKKFHQVTPLIDALVAVTETCVAQLNSEINDVLLAEEAAQLHFKVSNYYSLASTLDAQNYDLCSHWLEKVGDFIENNDLIGTENHAIWHNLMGGHQSRGFEMGLFEVFPHSCVKHFQAAVKIHEEELDSKVENANDVNFRHAIMCLASVTAQEILQKVLLQGAVTADIKLACDETLTILNTLTDDVLVLKDGSPDYYRIAGCWKVESIVALLSGEFLKAREAIDYAEEAMEASIAETGSTGQLSAILNDVNNVYIALGTVKALKSKALSEGQFEDMYSKEASRQLESMASNTFSQLARIIVKGEMVLLKPELPEPILATEDQKIPFLGNIDLHEFSYPPEFTPAFSANAAQGIKKHKDIALGMELNTEPPKPAISPKNH